MPGPISLQLEADAQALDREAAAATWIAGLSEDQKEKDRVLEEARVMQAWASLNRVVAGQNPDL